MERQALEKLGREELIQHAEAAGVPRPRALTVAELIDEILSRSLKSEPERKKARGWLGRARDLLASVVERGLHLPGAAKVLRAPDPKPWPVPPPPLPTVTLAEIYAAQGHLDRAVAVLDEVLAREPDHAEARALRDRFVAQAKGRKSVASDAAPEVASAPTAAASTTKDASEPSESVAPAETGGAAAEATSEPADDAAALPERYEVDEIVALAVDPQTVYFYWEILPTTLAAARARSPRGAVVVRIVSVVASWDGPLTRARDVPVDALFGDRFVGDLIAGSQVRVSIGWASESGFEPFAVGVEVELPRAKPVASAATEVAAWTPRPEPVRAARATPALATAIDRGHAVRAASEPASVLATAPGEKIVEAVVSERVEGPAVVRTRRIVRVFPSGASELVREVIDETTVERSDDLRSWTVVSRFGASELARRGASELARLGASELVRPS